MKDELTPFFPCTWEETLAYLNRETGAKAGDVARVIRAANHAAGYAERRTRRNLVARTYRAPVSIASCVVTSASATVTGSGFTAGVKVLDEVVGAGLKPGTRVASVESNTSLTLSKLAESGATLTLAFGSARLAVDGNGGQTISVPEYPVHDLYSAAYLDDAGAETAMDITGHRLAKVAGRLYLPNDSFPEGAQNVLLGCLAGYVEPSATVRGDWSDWTTIQHLYLRLTQVFFQDEANQPGRVVDKSIGQVSANLPDFRMPGDIEDMLQHYARLW